MSSGGMFRPRYLLIFIILASCTLLLRNVLSSLRREQARTLTIFSNANFVFKKVQGLSRLTPSINTSITIAYCIYPQSIRPGEPVLGAEYLARTLGPLAFPDRQVRFVECLAVPEQLPDAISASSVKGMQQLGLYDVHVRFCSYGSSSVIKESYGRLKSTTNQIRLSYVTPTAQTVSEDENLHLPSSGRINVYTSTEGAVIGPLITRTNREAWFESVPGVALQFDTKLTNLAQSSYTVYMPYAYESFGRSRWNGGHAKRKIAKHQESFGKNDMFHLRESVTRPNAGFDARKERESKQYFMAMINSNCGRSHIKTTLIRGLFGYAVFEMLGKPVHNLGKCPLNPEGAVRAGITEEERSKFVARWGVGKGQSTPAQEIFAHHKFSICFENTNAEGYITEKIVTPYNARSVPVYWGGGNTIAKVLNKKAFIHCDIPGNVTALLQEPQYSAYVDRICSRGGGLRPESPECSVLISNDFYREIFPFFKPCIEEISRLDRDDEAYERMLAEPLVPLDAKTGELAEFWNETAYALAIRAAFDRLGYENGPVELKKVLLDQVEDTG